MAPPRTYAWIAAVSFSVLGVYAILSLTLPRGESLNTFGNIMQCLVPLLANAGLLLNAGTPHWRRNVFWMLTAMSCTLWMIGQFQWTYYEVYLHQSLPDLYPGDIIFFLRGVPLMAALASGDKDATYRAMSIYRQIDTANYRPLIKVVTDA